jgi:hypothetical protein
MARDVSTGPVRDSGRGAGDVGKSDAADPQIPWEELWKLWKWSANCFLGDSTSVQRAWSEKGQNNNVFGTLFGSFAGITRDRLG